jgi:hypothetical protein
MNRMMVSLAAALALVNGGAWAQPNDALGQLRACSVLEGTDRLQCLNALSRAIEPLARRKPSGSGWTISQTTSPVDYTPIATATTSAVDSSDGPGMQLAIKCRGNRTDLVLVGPSISGRGEEYAISYRIKDGPAAQFPGAAPALGVGVGFTGDVVRLLRSLPDQGDFAVHLARRTGTAQDAIFSLTGLARVREKMATVCKWPHEVAEPKSSPSK